MLAKNYLFVYFAECWADAGALDSSFQMFSTYVEMNDYLIGLFLIFCGFGFCPYGIPFYYYRSNSVVFFGCQIRPKHSFRVASMLASERAPLIGLQLASILASIQWL